MDLKTNAEQELAVYESVDVESNSEDEPIAEPVNENISRSIVTRDSALEAFVEPARRIDDTVSTRVARIRREIEELRRSGAEIEAADLLADLKSLIKPRVENSIPDDKGPHQTSPDSSGHSIESRLEFASLESRVAKLESKFGVSVRSSRSRPESLASSVAHLKRTVELLASNPQSVSTLIDKLRSLQSDKPQHLESKQSRIDALYYRLAALDEAIDVLPHVVSRLQTLRYVHTETVIQQQQFKDIQVTIESMQGELKSWRTILETLESRVSQYIDISQRNIEKLQQ